MRHSRKFPTLFHPCCRRQTSCRLSRVRAGAADHAPLRMRHSDLFAAVMEKALTTGATVRFRAEGTSMHPTIRDGESISIAAVSPAKVVRGDVLLCRHDRRVLAHRVVGVTTRGTGRVFELRGDAKAACDAPVGADDVVGQVVAVQRNGRPVRLCGRAARLRFAARTAASRAKSFVVPAASLSPWRDLLRSIEAAAGRRWFGDT
jgi:signal peptidase I